MTQRAIILAAGRGSRLGAMADAQPKCLTPLAGRPLLCWQIAALRAAGVAEIAVVRGYRAEALARPDVVAFDNPRWAETNMVGTLAQAHAWLEAGPCLVCYADIVYHPDIVRELAAAEAPLAITYDRLWRALWGQRFADPLADAETFRAGPDGELREIGGRAAAAAEIHGQYMGLLRFAPDGWGRARRLLDALPPGDRDRLDMTALLRLLLADGAHIQTVPVSGRWCEVDSAQDIETYERRLRGPAPWPHDWRWEGDRRWGGEGV